MNLYIITGTTKGLGKALLEAALKQANAKVLTIARSPSSTSDAHCNIEFDLTKPHQIGDAWEKGLAWLKPSLSQISHACLINNAGVVSPVAPITGCYGSAIEHAVNVNLTSPLMLMHHFVSMKLPAEASKSIINISSGAARRPIASWSSYCSSKAGLDMATRVVVEEAAQRGWKLRACSLAPGVIDTPMQAQIRSTDPAAFADVARFQQIKDEGGLAVAADVAQKIIALDLAGKLPDGLADIREL
jgi:benzil reductase ((S)-benzoin forming)